MHSQYWQGESSKMEEGAMRLDLYFLWECPHSAKVMEYIEREKIEKEIRLHELDEEEVARAKLVHFIGGTQVPCLVHDGKPLLQSGKIIDWLRTNVVCKRKKSRVFLKRPRPFWEIFPTQLSPAV